MKIIGRAFGVPFWRRILPIPSRIKVVIKVAHCRKEFANIIRFALFDFNDGTIQFFFCFAKMK